MRGCFLVEKRKRGQKNFILKQTESCALKFVDRLLDCLNHCSYILTYINFSYHISQCKHKGKMTWTHNNLNLEASEVLSMHNLLPIRSHLIRYSICTRLCAICEPIKARDLAGNNVAMYESPGIKWGNETICTYPQIYFSW
jgi:hypothetical protein